MYYERDAKEIPHEWVVRTAANEAEFNRYAKLPLVPLVVMPDGQGLQDSTPIIEHFEEYFGVSADYRPNGYLFLLTRPEEVSVFRSNLALQHSLGAVWSRWVDLDEIHRITPLVNLDGILGGTFCPRDGFADPNTINQVYANEARKRGARIETEARVTGIEREGDRIRGVVTNQGRVETNTVVNCCGPWSAEIGKMVGLDIPIAPMRRQASITTPMSEFPPTATTASLAIL